MRRQSGQRGVVGVRRHKESQARVLRLIKLNLLEPNRYQIADAYLRAQTIKAHQTY